MKRFYFVLFFAGVMILLVSPGCSKELPASGSGINTVTNHPPPPPPNRPPVALAGPDFTGTLYSNDMKLRGHAYDQDMDNTLTTNWTQIAGAPCTIVSPQSRTTVVTNLLVGEYQFELLARDNHGATNTDKIVVKINSIEPITSPVNIFNLSWTCPMGCSIPIYNIYSHIPPNAPIRVFIKFVNSAIWHEAVPMSQYSPSNSIYYEIDTENSIWLYTDVDVNINVDVRILF
ncbi:hypothetical protein CAP36_16260 [Chitinophagaceae bacterium IBVUCB2]|nr:hypothetical protein CAP36_16260 [Chitinophagaceae bacterium IBVUCB2]